MSPDRIIFSGNSVSAKKLYLLYDEKDKHYNVITNLKAAMAKSIYVICVTLRMTLHTNVTKLVPYVLLHHPVQRIRLRIVLLATGSFSVRNVSRII